MSIKKQECKDENEIDNFYGFIAQNVKKEDEIFFNEINNVIYHMINDFLREDIPVYWTSENLNLSCVDQRNQKKIKKSFDKGAFIIPFKKDDFVDTEICVIIEEYIKKTKNLDKNCEIPIYKIIKKLKTSAYSLNEPRIARYNEDCIENLQRLIEFFIKAGFLKFDKVDIKKTKEKLSKEKYNLIIWQGLSPAKNPSKYHIYKSMIFEKKYKIIPSIRKYIASGGNYFGICWGSFKATDTWINPFKKGKKVNFGLLRISDIVCTNPTKKTIKDLKFSCKQKIIDFDHPVSFGLNHLIDDEYAGGPKFIDLGENSKTITVYEGLHDFFDGTPAWISSRYKKGKIVLFGSHPDIPAQDKKNYFSLKAIYNTIYFLTSDDLTEFCCSYSRESSFCSRIFDKTKDLFTDSKVINPFFSDQLREIKSIKESLDILIARFKKYVENIENNSVKDDDYVGVNSLYSKISHNSDEILKDLEFSCFYLNEIKDYLDSIQGSYEILKDFEDFSKNIVVLRKRLSLDLFRIYEQISKIDKRLLKFEKKLSIFKDKMNNIGSFRGIFIQFSFNRMRNQSSDSFLKISKNYSNLLIFFRNYKYYYKTFVSLS
jgi:hypothetical protein